MTDMVNIANIYMYTMYVCTPDNHHSVYVPYVVVSGAVGNAHVYYYYNNIRMIEIE